MYYVIYYKIYFIKIFCNIYIYLKCIEIILNIFKQIGPNET